MVFAACLEIVRLISTYLFLTLQKMYYHKVKTSLSSSMILELQKQRETSRVKHVDVDLACNSSRPALWANDLNSLSLSFPFREIGMRRPALRKWSGQ